MKKYTVCFVFIVISCFIYYVNRLDSIPSPETMLLINQQWKANQKLLCTMEALKFDPKLGLYTPLDPKQINVLNQTQLKLREYIDYNNYLINIVLKNYSSNITNQLRNQNEILKFTNFINNSLIYRKEQRYKDALDSLDQAFTLIANKRTFLENVDNCKTHEELLSLIYYQRGKIHRMMAGKDLFNLKQSDLVLCEKNYQLALALSPNNHAIHSSLGFLYNDMGKLENAKNELEIAQSLHPEFPEYLHGVAYTYYKIEKANHERSMVMSQGNLDQSKEIFERAIQLFQKFGTINSRIYLDYGKLLYLMKDEKLALYNFNEGLKIDPDHPLLLLERGLLFASMGKYLPALNDLRSGKIASRSDLFMHDKFIKLCKNLENKIIENDIKIFSSSQSIQPLKKSNITFTLLKEQMNHRNLTNKMLNKFNLYSKKSKKHPICYIAYAWDVYAHEQWVFQFSKDLEAAGCHVLLDRWFTRKGQDTMQFIEKMLSEDTDYIIVVGSKRFLEKYNRPTTIVNNKMLEFQRDHVLKIETRIINYIIGFSETHSNRIVPILIEGTPEESLPPLLKLKNISNFVNKEYYEQLHDLLKDLHRIPNNFDW